MKTIIITGSSRGIGKETALKFAKKNSRVIVTYAHDRAAADETARRCRELGAETQIEHLDVADDDSIKRFCRKFTEIDVLINNAGVGQSKSLEGLDFEDIEKILRTNLEGLIKITRLMLAKTRTIINISSGAGKRGYPGLSVYCASKFGVRGFTEAVSKEYKNIYCVNPGMTKTRMTNYRGTDPGKVAQVIYDTADGRYPGWEIDVYEVI